MRNIDVPVWSNDGTRVSYMGRPVRGADPKTFEVLLGDYARDAHSVFFQTKSRLIDRNTFRVLNTNFGVDAKNAFFAVTPIRGADVHSFRVLDSSLSPAMTGSFLARGYAADANSVWHASGEGIFLIKSADPRSFISLNNRFGCDAKQVYFERAVLRGSHRATWRPWKGRLSVDKDHVYFTNKRIALVDRASIWPLQVDDCFMGRERIYSGIEPITVERYLPLLKHQEERCIWEKEWLLNGKMFDRVLDEWPKTV